MSADIEELKLTTTGFAELMLQLPLYDWQAKACLPLEKWKETGKRQNVAICAPNGSGKDDRIIPAMAYWWLFFHPHGRVVVTSKSDTQLTQQTEQSLNKHWRKFGWSPPVQSPRYTLVTTTGGSLIAFVTNEGARLEGFHSRPGEPLLMIVNEAKFFSQTNYEGVDRCSPDVLVLISSPGSMEGRFYECFNSLVEHYTTIRAGLADCPHISEEKIKTTIATYGADDPITRSMLYGEFMKQEEGVFLCCTVDEYESCINSPPEHKPGFRYGFFDFADGRAENVLVVRDGNKYRVADKWRETNEDAVVGRAIWLLNENGLKDGQWGADAAAKSILDKMAHGINGRHGKRQNFGAIDKTGTYKSWSALAWLEGANKIKKREVILPADLVLRKQVTSRRKVFELNGKLGVEPKHKMLEERGIESPDRADALFGCMAERDTRLDIKSNIVDMSHWIVNDSPNDERELAASVGH